MPYAEPWEYELRFPRDPRAPWIARTTLRAVLDAHGLDELADRAELLTSELATNSVRHTKGPASVRLRWAHPVLRVSVSDSSPVFPMEFPAPDGDAEGGRGLVILELIADQWGGCCPDETLFGVGGKTIWFELRAADDGSPPPAVAALAA
ncbi:ATP-binding protein [Streptomyces sp. NBC_01214]|uniref:ATP-binding protein n=1 Tax=Streptomyces sp. NBC_01214 TaxID=2903777 RepID=UPI002253D0E6|nr:ATP-binding protein [Streptomyces sp. NBC_01214]MCX4805910.1 ATP-binding protein [Streptomyces sp. NBC_01214]